MIQRSVVAASGRPLIQLRNVSKSFAMHREYQRSFQETFIRLALRRRIREQQFQALSNVSFEVNEADCFGIVGPNGSGKSTLLKLITGILDPTSGDIITRGRIASLLELGAGFHPDLTGRENIFLNGSVYGLTHKQMQQRLDQIIDFTELGDFIDVPIKHYSSGMYVRLGFAVAIHTDPTLLLVDEVLAVGDASFQHKCLDSIQQFRAQGGTLVLVTHDLGTVQSLCNQAIWLDGGEVRAAGQPTDVAMAYLNEVAQREENQAAAAPSPALHDGLNRWGNGRIRITQVELCDEAGEARRIFMNGRPLQVRLHYRAEGRVDDPVFGLAIHHQAGAHIAGPNTDFGGLRIAAVEGEGVVTYRIPELTLLEGAYLVSAAVVDRVSSEVYDYHDRTYPFRVSTGASRERYGMVTLKGEWQISTNDAAGDR